MKTTTLTALSKMQALIQLWSEGPVSFNFILIDMSPISSFFLSNLTLCKSWCGPLQQPFFLFLPLFLQKNVVKHVRATVEHKSGPINLPWVLSSLRPLSQCDTLLKSSKVIYTKYSKHWTYTVAHTIDCVCIKC